MTNRLNKNFLHFKGDYLVLEYLFEDISDLNTLLKNADNAVQWNVKLDSQTIISKTKLNGITVDGSKLNILYVPLTPADTISLTPNKYNYQLKIIDLNSNPITVAVGEMDLRESF